MTSPGHRRAEGSTAPRRRPPDPRETTSATVVRTLAPGWLALVAVGIGLVLLVGCAAPSRSDNPAGIVVDPGSSTSRYAGVQTAFEKPDVTLTDIDGQPFNLRTDTTAPLTLVFFGYTSCPDVCTIVLREVAAGLNKLDTERKQGVQVVFVTTDPARDTGAAMTSYLDTFGFGSYIGLTGPISTIERAAAPLQVEFFAEDKLPSGGYEVAHSAHVVGFAADGTSVLWTQGTPVADLAHDFALLAA